MISFFRDPIRLMITTIKVPRLKPGDRVRLLSPSSTPDPEKLRAGVRLLESWGLKAEIGAHALDRHGHYLAGTDQDRLSDWNEAVRDPGVRAIFTTRGGKGAYRIAHAIDFAAAQLDPKPWIGFSDATILHLGLWHHCRVPSFHGPHIAWEAEYFGPRSAESLRRGLMEPQPITIHQDEAELTAQVVLPGTARGVLLGGNLSMIGRAIGWACPRLTGAILFLEAVDSPIGQIDATLTQLRRAGYTEGLQAVAVGQFIRSAEPRPGHWSVLDVLYDHFSSWGVPVLGGLPVGHGPHPPTIPLGTMATVDTATRRLTIEPGIC